MASLLNWLGTAAQGIVNGAEGLVGLHPQPSRPQPRPAQIPQRPPAQASLAPLSVGNIARTIQGAPQVTPPQIRPLPQFTQNLVNSSPLGAAANLVHTTAPVISQGLQGAAKVANSAPVQKLPVAGFVARNVVAPVLQSQAQTVSNVGKLAGGQNPYQGMSSPQAIGSGLSDVANLASFLPASATLDASKVAVKGGKLLPKVTKSAGANAAYGTAFGVGSGLQQKGATPGSVIGSGVAGGVAGGVLGGTIPVAGAAASKAVKAGVAANQRLGEVGAIGLPKDNTGALFQKLYKPSNPSPEEQQAAAHIMSNPQKALDTYKQLAQKEFGASNVVSGDVAKYAIPGMKSANSAHFHEPASALAKAHYDQLLADPTTLDKPVQITAGGSGAGKTATLRQFGGKALGDYAATVDTNLNGFKKAVAKIDAARATGRLVEVNYVYRNPIDAFKSVVERGTREDRVVPISGHVDNHLGSREVIPQLQQHYANDPGVKINAYLNTGKSAAEASHSSIDKLPQIGYNKDELHNTLKGIVDEAKQKGIITPEAHATYLGQTAGSVSASPESISQGRTAAETVSPNRFTEHVQASPEVSSATQQAVSGQHAVRNTATLAASGDQFVKSQPLDRATQTLYDRLAVPDGQINDKTVADTIAGAKANDAAGNHDAATSLYDQLSQHLTKLGQNVQAAAILASRTPDGQKFQALKFLTKAGVKLTPDLKNNLEGIIARMRATTPGSKEYSEATQDLSKLVSRHMPSKLADKAFTLWRTGLLTGPQTVTKVLISHGVLNTAEAIKDPIAVALDRAVSLFSKQRSTALTERGRIGGAITGTKAATHLLRTGYETAGTGSLSDTAAGRLANPGVSYGNGIVGRMLNSYTQKVGELHAALPKAFYKQAEQNDLFKQALAAAKTNKVARGNLDSYINDFVTNATDQAKNESALAAQRANFQQPTKLGKAAMNVQKGGFRVLMPFAHIASAILSDVGDYSPLGAGKAVYQAVKENGAQGWTPTVQKHFVEELGRSITGTGVLAMGYALYKAGVMTLGYPSGNPKETALWKASGKQENAILLGGKWRSTAALGPLGTLLAMGGYGAQSGQTNNKGASQATAALFGALKNITGQSYLSGLSEAATAVNDPNSAMGTFIKSTGSSIVPTGIATVARATDPLQRQSNNVAQAIESKIPGLRQALLPSQDGFGNNLPRQGGVLTNLLDPSRPTSAVNNPVVNELNRLDNTGNTTMVTPTKTITAGSANLKLTPAQINDRNASVGPQIFNAYNKTINAPGYAALSDANKAKALSNAASDLNSVQNVKTLNQIGNTAAAQKAYSGLDSNQKAMLNGQPSVKDYTNLTTAGTTKTVVDPRQAYQQAVAKYQQQVKAGLLSPEQQYTQSLALGKQNITSQYPTEVKQLYDMSKTDLLNFFSQNPTKQSLLDQVKQLDQQLTNQGFTSNEKFKTVASDGSSTTATRAKGATVRLARKAVRVPKPKALTSDYNSSLQKLVSGLKIRGVKGIKAPSLKVPKMPKVPKATLAKAPKLPKLAKVHTPRPRVTKSKVA